MRTQPTNTMPALNTDSSSMDKLGPKPRRSRGEGTGRYSNTDSSHQPLQQNGHTNTESTQHFSRC